MEDFEKFIQMIFTLPKRKPKVKKRSYFKKIVAKPMAVQPDEFLTHSGKPFRFSRKGAKRPIEKRKR